MHIYRVLIDFFLVVGYCFC